MAAVLSKAEQPVTGVRSVVPHTNGVPVVDPFAPLRAIVEQMVKDAREEGHKVGLVAGRVEGLRRACRLLSIAAGQLSLEDRCKLGDAFESLEHELTK